MQNEAIGDILAASGVLGCIFIVFFGTIVLALLPVWAIIDCAISNKSSESKTIWIVIIFFTWGIGSLIYGTFFAESKALRITGVVSILGTIAISFLTVASVIAGVTMSEGARKEKLEQLRKRDPVVQTPLKSFPAVQETPSNFDAPH